VSYLELVDWRRRVADLFGELRRRPADAETLAWFRARKDELFRSHAQSPLPPEARASFRGLGYWPFDGTARIRAAFIPLDAQPALDGGSSTGEDIPLARIGRAQFAYGGQTCALDVFWVRGYGGGLFVPFRDATSSHETYGGGRYLLDTIKGADHGSDPRLASLLLDFNYAYHPSCVYDPRWSCPLAPASNWLTFAVRAGERL
jgi:uncharacterized protein (DUF1684 family)